VQLYRLDSPASPFTLSPGKVKGLPRKRSVPGKVRVVKDVLPLGTFRGWKVTPEILDDIVRQFYAQKEAGVRHPLCWGHGQIALGVDTDPRDTITDVDDVWHDGERLWMSAYVPKDKAAELIDTRREVSITAAKDWTDGAGRKWDGICLLHVAVVTHAAVPGQDPFIELSAPIGGPMTYDVVVESMNKLAKAAGFPGLPESLTEANFNDVVPAIVDAWTGQTKKDEDPMADAADKTKEAPVVEKEPVTMTATVSAAELATLSATVANLTAKLESLETEKANKSKTDFESHLEACLAAGLPAAMKPTLVTLGAELNYSPSAFATLNSFATSHKLVLGSQIGGVVTSKEPEVGISEADRTAAKAALGLKPKS